ncbi:MAG: sulfotransferase domain-containing protein [Leptolyngbyaceae bacterium]|nr:sulfotransferase domain-containing protein [Leptolyngbyaceae bacterium]
MFHYLRKTAKTVFPPSFRSNFRGAVQPVVKLWRRSPLAEYIAHRRAEVYLISFARSGRTWLRTMIGTALCDYFDLDIAAPERIADLWQQDARIPAIRLDHSAIRLENPNKFKQKKIILLVRNPLDIGVSQYHFQQRQGAIDADVFPIVESVVNSYNAWAIFMREHPACLLIKYEDLLATPELVLTEIFEFINLPQVCEGEVLRRTVEICSFENMKKLANDPERSLFYRPNSSAMVRSGKVGSSKAELPPSTYKELQEFVTQTLSEDFNYTDSSNV